MSNPAPIPNDSKPVWEYVIEDMKARDNFGRAKYKTPLQMTNDRNHAQDAYEEVLDLSVYMKQVIIERTELFTRIEQLMNDACIARDLIKELNDEINPPERNCSCHISPPCSDCVDHEHARELKARAESYIS